MKPALAIAALALPSALALAACSPEQDREDQAERPMPVEPDGGIGDGEGPPADAPESLPTHSPDPNEQALLDSRDCETVAAAYADAVAARDFISAARFWDDPAADAARLEALFGGYEEPQIAIAELMEEGAAGSLYCTVTGSLSDVANPATPLREGQIVLRRANDVPGASAAQLRWRIETSTFVERMQRAGRGEPS